MATKRKKKYPTMTEAQVRAMLKQAAKRQYAGRLEVYVSPDLKQRFKEACESRGVTMLETVALLMEQYAQGVHRA